MKFTKMTQLGKSLCQTVRQFMQNNWHYVIVVIFGLVASAALWSNLGSLIYGYDFTFHTARLQSATHAWRNGQFLPQVDPNGAEGLGYAYNLFYGPLLTYVSAFFRCFSSGWIVAINLTYVFLVLLSGILMCYTVVKITKNKTWATLAGVFYLFAPYHLLNLYSRMAAGEFAAMAVAPILLLGLYQLVNHEKGAVRNIVIAAVGLILTHSTSALLFAIIAAIYLLCNLKQVWNWKSLRQILLAGAVVLGLSAFFLLPLVEAKLVGNYGIFDTTYSRLQFWAEPGHLNWHRLDLSDILWGSGYNLQDAFPHNREIGIIALIGLFGFPFVARKIRSRAVRKFLWIIYVLAIGSLVMTGKLVDWQCMPSILWMVQFPWRWTIIFDVLMVIISAAVIHGILEDLKLANNRAAIVVIGLLAALNVYPLFAVTASNLRHPEGVFPSTDIVQGVTGSQVEYAPLQLLCADRPWIECNTQEKFVNTIADRGREVEVITGKAELKDIQHDGLKYQLQVKTTEVAKLEFPLIWYPGYQAKLGKEKLPVRASEKYGLVEIELPANAEGEVRLSYGMSVATKIGVAISALTAAGCVAWVIYPKVKWRLAKKS